ncbi:MAG: hypothetical protein QM811_00780 [Pirellulales bacterium]
MLPKKSGPRGHCSARPMCDVFVIRTDADFADYAGDEGYIGRRQPATSAEPAMFHVKQLFPGSRRHPAVCRRGGLFAQETVAASETRELSEC